MDMVSVPHLKRFLELLNLEVHLLLLLPRLIQLTTQAACLPDHCHHIRGVLDTERVTSRSPVGAFLGELAPSLHQIGWCLGFNELEGHVVVSCRPFSLLR
jgi:hypothetical protein